MKYWYWFKYIFLQSTFGVKLPCGHTRVIARVGTCRTCPHCGQRYQRVKWAKAQRDIIDVLHDRIMKNPKVNIIGENEKLTDERDLFVDDECEIIGKKK